MNAMIAAIKKRKAAGQEVEGDHQDMGHDSQHTADADKTKDLHGFVSSLSEGEKHQLRGILDKSNNNGQEIAKGGPSSEEKTKIDDSMAKENAETSLEQESDVDSDAIGKSMLDSRFLGSNPPSHNPRNLGERVKMDIHKKLKDKGKV